MEDKRVASYQARQGRTNCVGVSAVRSMANTGFTNIGVSIKIGGIEKEKRLSDDEKCQKRNVSKKIWNERASHARRNVHNINSCKSITTKVPFTRQVPKRSKGYLCLFTSCR